MLVSSPTQQGLVTRLVNSRRRVRCRAPLTICVRTVLTTSAPTFGGSVEAQFLAAGASITFHPRGLLGRVDEREEDGGRQ